MIVRCFSGCRERARDGRGQTECKVPFRGVIYPPSPHTRPLRSGQLAVHPAAGSLCCDCPLFIMIQQVVCLGERHGGRYTAPLSEAAGGPLSIVRDHTLCVVPAHVPSHGIPFTHSAIRTDPEVHRAGSLQPT